ncbi:TonB family C-terminal domain-containing protein [Chitinophaga sp. YR573]|uniref:TonB family protein n=1 Tax=Chitinophaga sp. YR573 TaxID=1881040 RepID=UPI0008D6EC57|nr:TonB family protein [Chitinophaga sp. YR573]SEW12930.1 TonB family C-terminal domain-containing protein [Chitinophaga sp. YR573]
MPHKHNDIKHGVDPEQIRRYLAGELDDKAMHILERQALEDPFLAEALDGFTGYAADQTVNLDDLDRRLEKRVAGAKERKMFVYYRWAAAAVVLIVAGVGVMKLWQAPVKQEIADVKVLHDSVPAGGIIDESGQSLAARADQQHPTAIPDLKLKKERNQSAVPEERRSAPEIVETSPLARGVYKQSDSVTGAMDIAASKAAPAPVPAASIPAPGSVVVAEKAAVVPVSADMASEKEVTEDDKKGVASVYSPPKALTIRGRGVKVTQNQSNVALFPGKMRMLQGKITDANNDSGLAYASVAVAGTNKGALTDKDGYFTIAVDSTANVQLNVAALGWASKNVLVNNNENNLRIALPENQQSLNEEVVVTAYGTKKAKKAVYQAPQPGEGLDRYKEYLAKNVRYPASAGGVKGRVRVAFTVKADGTLEDFKILRKLQPDCDAEAIRVVKEGPAWIPASDGRATRAQVDVPFAP